VFHFQDSLPNLGPCNPTRHQHHYSFCSRGEAEHNNRPGQRLRLRRHGPVWGCGLCVPGMVFARLGTMVVRLLPPRTAKPRTRGVICSVRCLRSAGVSCPSEERVGAAGASARFVRNPDVSRCEGRIHKSNISVRFLGTPASSRSRHGRRSTTHF
jgi:hypothetical protein